MYYDLFENNRKSISFYKLNIFIYFVRSVVVEQLTVLIYLVGPLVKRNQAVCDILNL